MFTIANVLSKFMQAQNIVTPITIINFIALGINCIFNGIFIYALNWGLRYSIMLKPLAFSILITTVKIIKR